MTDEDKDYDRCGNTDCDKGACWGDNERICSETDDCKDFISIDDDE